jgi:transcriptional regulator with XRE-family HTH domain
MSTIIGRKIQKRRKELGITQEELASKMGYKSKSSINKIELGINDIPQNKISLFADALMTTPSYLMGWEDGNVYHCPDDENPWILKICEIMERADVDTQIAICQQAELTARGENAGEQLTEQERTLLRLFRDTTEEGKMRMIQSVLNIHDAAVKSSDAAGDTRLA